MKIVFFGSSYFAVPSLDALLKSRHEVTCVVTRADKQRGRHLRFFGTDLKDAASRARLKIFQPEDVNSQESLNFLKGCEADVFVIIAYGQILSRDLLAVPKIMPINVHASLLPRYRGAAPINWAIINGEKKSGISIIFVTSRMDAGPIIMQEEVEIESRDTAASLGEKLSLRGAGSLIQALVKIENHDYCLINQDEDKVILAPKMRKEDGLIDWNASSADVYNQVRGVLPWPGAFTSWRGKTLKVFQPEIFSMFSGHCPCPGEVVRADKSGIVTACGSGFLKITELQLEAGRRMSAQSFIAGHRISAGDIFGKK